VCSLWDAVGWFSLRSFFRVAKLLLGLVLKFSMGEWEVGSESLSTSDTLVQFLPEGEPMLNLANAVRQLKVERDQAQRKLEQLNAALKVLGSLGGVSRGLGGGQTARKKRRPMSAAARKRIAAAQRARWAKWKAARRNK
jgi:hypothetical protein